MWKERVKVDQQLKHLKNPIYDQNTVDLLIDKEACVMDFFLYLSAIVHLASLDSAYNYVNIQTDNIH